jgi:hypothetical protein
MTDSGLSAESPPEFRVALSSMLYVRWKFDWSGSDFPLTILPQFLRSQCPST